MRLTACLAAALLLVSAGARATVLPKLYEATVPVADQSLEARDPALRRALQVVLFRVTGSHDLPQDAQAALLGRAPTLVQGYGYEPAASGQGLLLHAQFDARATANALREQNLPVWGTNRPSHLVWIALQGDGQPRAVLDAAGIAARAPAVAATADARGLPFNYPAVNASEKQLASFDQVWTGNYTGVLGASRNYNADMIVVGRVGRESGRWLARWALLKASGGAEEWSATRDSLDEVLATGVGELADREAQRFATSGTSAQEARLRVSGVASLDDYGRVLNYFRGLNAVRGTQVEAVDGDVLTVRLRIEGDPSAVSRAIGSGSVLRETADEHSGLSYALVH